MMILTGNISIEGLEVIRALHLYNLTNSVFCRKHFNLHKKQPQFCNILWSLMPQMNTIRANFKTIGKLPALRFRVVILF
ncbi:hypothetical protein AM461_08825 [Providencia rettgeri]|nr:hypothetical protein AM461_08825 [Providencia rettgeri]